jgi:signal transduction histidine kinase
LARTNGLWLRAGLCLAIGFSFFLLENSQSFDLRFQIRGPQNIDSRIGIVEISMHEWERYVSTERSFMLPLREFAGFDDLFFWNERMWQRLLSKILSGEPRSVGVTFFFPSSGLSSVNSSEAKIFKDPRVYWLARQDTDGRVLSPFAASFDHSNIGLLGAMFDDDRVMRKYGNESGGATLAEKVASPFGAPEAPVSGELINFRLAAKDLSKISLAELLSPDFDVKSLKGKIILIGTPDIESHLVRTPLGDMNRAEVVATQVDNLLDHRFIRSLPAGWIVLVLLLQLVFCIWLMSTYPQSVAFVFLVWAATGWTAFSLWIFDTYYFWLPILAPVAQGIVTYVIFLGYQLTLKENEAWRLEQEKKYLSEIEQLKNNFVSLISHDLKTPIAKIQAICDRLLAQQSAPEVQEGLQSLRQESSELHRYIQSILKMSRVESRNFQLNKEASDINEMTVTVLRQLKPLIAQKNLQLELKLEPIFSIEVDALLIQEVILNLVENAVKYTPEGGRIEIRSSEIENEVLFSVQDSGPGISQRDQDRVFEKFYRAPEQEHHSKGTGLGLYLVKYFIELHGGRVFLESSAGKGTRIGFRLPTDEESVQVRPNLTATEVKP